MATQLGPKAETKTRWNGAAYVNYPVKRCDNFVAATGLTFDYNILIAAYLSDGVTVDTSFTGAVTIAPSAGFTLGSKTSTPLTRNAVAGIADFSDLYPATGIGNNLTLTVSAAGLTSYVTRAMQVVTPQWDLFTDKNGVQTLVELPRLQVDTTYPTSFTKDYIVDPGATADGVTTFNTMQAASDRICNVDNPTGDVRIKVAGTHSSAFALGNKASPTGYICVEPTGGIPGTPGVRISPAEVQAKGVLFQSSDTIGTIQFSPGAHHWRFSGIEATVTYASTTDPRNSVIYIQDQNSSLAQPDSIYDTPHHIGFDRCYIHGQSDHTLQRCIQNDGRYVFVTNCYLDEAHATLSPNMGSGDEQAIANVQAPGPSHYENNYMRASGEVMMTGGADPSWVDVVNRDVTIRHNVFYSPIAWQLLYKHKNTIEWKNAARHLVEGNIFDGSWSQGQDGTGIKFNSANQGESAVNLYEGVQDITFRKNFCRTMQTFLTLAKTAGTANTFLMTRVHVHDNIAVNIDDPSTWTDTTGARIGASGNTRAVLLDGGLSAGPGGWGVRHNTVIGSPDALATSTRAVYFGDAANPHSVYDDNLSVARGVGAQQSGGGVAGTAFTGAMPDDNAGKNVFYDYDAAANGNPPWPATSAFPAHLANIGFTDVSGLTSYATLAPETIVAGLKLQAASPHSAANGWTDSQGAAKDAGADIDAVLAAITGVLAGTPGTSGTPTQLLLSQQPAGAVSGQPLTQQPVVRVADSGGSTVTSDTSTVTATLNVLTGTGSITAGGSMAASSGLATFTALTVTGTGTGTITFTDGSLTSVTSASFAWGSGLPASATVLPTIVDQWRPTQRNREGLEVVPSASPLIGTGGTTVQNSATTAVLIPVGRVKVSVLSLSLDAMTAAGSAGAVTVQAFKVSGGVSTALTAAQSIKSDVIASSGNVVLPVLASLFDGPSNGSRRIDGTRGDTLRVDIVAAGTITTQPVVRVVAELAVNS